MVRVLWYIILAGIALSGFSKDIPKKPDGHERFVQDYARILSQEQERYLIQKLNGYYDSTSTEIVVVTEKSTEGEAIDQYALKLAKSWGIGQEGKNNGVLIYIAFEDRQMDIEVGKGLEGYIADIDAKRIIERIMKPKFREERYGEGINEAIDAMIGLAAGTFVFEEQPQGKGIPVWVIILIVIILIIIFSRGGNSGQTYTHRRTSPWVWGSGGGGFGGGGSFGGGGFGGGFGGGSFGGGGASGSW